VRVREAVEPNETSLAATGKELKGGNVDVTQDVDDRCCNWERIESLVLLGLLLERLELLQLGKN
jgi:hypothetical protein